MTITARHVLIALAVTATVLGTIAWSLWLHWALTAPDVDQKANALGLSCTGLILLIANAISVIELWDSNPSITIGKRDRIPKAKVRR